MMPSFFPLIVTMRNMCRLPVASEHNGHRGRLQAAVQQDTFTATDRQRLYSFRQCHPEQWEAWTQDLNQEVASAADMSSAVDILTTRTRDWLRQHRQQGGRPPNLSLYKECDWATGIACMWAHYRAFRVLKGATLHTVLRAWSQVMCFQKLSRTHRKKAHLRRKRLQQLCLTERCRVLVKAYQ